MRSLLSFIDIEFLAANSKTNEKISNARICHEMDLQSFMVLKKKLFFRAAYRMVGSCVAILAMDSMVLFGGI